MFLLFLLFLFLFFNNARVEQSSPAPNSFNIPQKTQITQNKNYYNTSNNYNSNFDSFYPVYDDDVEIYRDVGE
jgi:hypothetical protein